eukprot:NODE_97_length_20652_cov_0.832093.p19 type:complete len:102 gc:universal NODE_97_length_20652_cov_0.832093:4091-3786(-)
MPKSIPLIAIRMTIDKLKISCIELDFPNRYREILTVVKLERCVEVHRDDWTSFVINEVPCKLCDTFKGLVAIVTKILLVGVVEMLLIVSGMREVKVFTLDV